mgnify:CR=1 FL=1
MKKKVVIIDYGLGNIVSAQQSFIKDAKENNLNVDVVITNEVETINNSTHIVLPGQGAFKSCIEGLRSIDGMIDSLENNVLNKKKPFLGICVGMQMMANNSEEGKLDGLGWIDANVKKFNLDKVDIQKFPLPHMGWNKVTNLTENELLKNLNNESRFYFLHSYYFDEKSSNDAIAQSAYIEKFTSIVKKNNIYGVQFHPEKSHENGIQLLKNFSDL